VQIKSPEDFSPADASAADVVIYEYTVPKELPGTNALLVMPPADPVFKFGVKTATHVGVTSWQARDPLTDGVNFRLLNFGQAEYFEGHSWMRQVVAGDDGGLLLAGERQGHRYIASGFNPFPYLGKKNLPMSILALNVLSHLAGLGSDAAGFRTGEPWLVPAGIEKIVLPSGNSIAVKPGTPFAEGSAQGIYQLVGAGGEKRSRAVNLANLGESNLDNPAAVSLQQPQNETAAPRAFRREALLSVYLIAAILALAALEALAAYRRRRGAVEMAQ
jgi:hypothetical protein